MFTNKLSNCPSNNSQNAISTNRGAERAPFYTSVSGQGKPIERRQVHLVLSFAPFQSTRQQATTITTAAATTTTGSNIMVPTRICYELRLRARPNFWLQLNELDRSTVGHVTTQREALFFKYDAALELATGSRPVLARVIDRWRFICNKEWKVRVRGRSPKLDIADFLCRSSRVES